MKDKHIEFPECYLIYKTITCSNSPVKDFGIAYVDENRNIYYQIGDKIFKTTAHFAKTGGNTDNTTLQDRVNHIISREVS